ncbi:hypothetical protein SKAU_G00009520 [Synaphobranchus kaupii]|uniref:SHSP domain-containing protein n=1 Tax=Synaphobranchus kaupii TaxID=118154 RepID=A0A9Q1JDD6_SYNKA|nr:hypothetical protein SKAU_G00009520 [Synaphobranchus kaupii]
MAEDDKCLPPPLFCRDLRWDPFRGWPRRSRIFDQDFGTPAFPEPCDLTWDESAWRRLGSSSWPGYRRAPLFSSSEQAPQEPGPKLRHPLPGGVSEILTGQDRWQVNLDINHFSPEEISIKTKEGYLEITGKHEERQDEHGFVSRYFTRKYKLPAGIDLQHISSSLSGDGVLSVEGPLPTSSSSAEIVIPIQVEDELQTSDCKVKEDQVQVEPKTEDVAGGEEIGEKQAADTEGLQSPPTQGPSDQPEGGEQPQQAPAAQSESSVEQGEELQADGPEERAAVSGGEEAPVELEGDTVEEQVDPKPAQEERDVAQEQEASGDHEDQAASDAGVEVQGKPSEPAPETEPQQDAAGEPVQEPPETASAEDPEPAPSQEAPSPEEPQPTPSQEGQSPEDPEPAPSQEAPSPEEPQPTPSQEGQSPEDPEPAPSQEAPSPEEPQTAPSQEGQSPEDPEPAPSQEAPSPEEPQSAPSQEALSPEEPEPAPSQEAPSPEQDIPEQQEIEKAELTKGQPES